MAKVLTEEQNLKDIAGAIRNKLEVATKFSPPEMADAIRLIESYPEPFGSISITENGVANVKDYEFADVDVQVELEPEDEGKVVSNGELVEQTSRTVTENDTYDTTTNNEVVVNVPNTYTAEDEGKVVDDGALVTQGSQTITENGTYDTTLIAELIANISGGGGGAKNILGGTTEPTSAEGTDGDIYIKYSDKHVPSGYTAVAYIENTAQGAYINTGYLFKANSRIEMDVNMSGGSTYPSPFGCRTNTTGSGTNQWYFSPSGNSVYYAMGNNQRKTDSSWAYNTKIHISAKAGEATMSGGVEKTIYTDAQSGVGTVPIHLFAMNLNNSPWTSSWSVMKLYSFQIYEGDTIVMDLVPAIRNSDDVVGLYDLENDEFYTNSGTGTFTAGAEGSTPIDVVYLKVDGSWIILEDGNWDDVNTEGGGGDEPLPDLPSEYQKVEYITFNNAYISLQAPLDGTQYEVKGSPSVTPNEMAFLSFKDSANSQNDIEIYTYGHNASPNVWARDNSIAELSYDGLLITSSVVPLAVDGNNKAYTLIYTILFTVGADYSQIASTIPVRLGAYYNTSYFRGKIYYLKAKRNDSIVECYVPCYRKSDSVAGFYETVGGTFHPAEAGSFTAGSEVN